MSACWEGPVAVNGKQEDRRLVTEMRTGTQKSLGLMSWIKESHFGIENKAIMWPDKHDQSQRGGQEHFSWSLSLFLNLEISISMSDFSPWCVTCSCLSDLEYISGYCFSCEWLAVSIVSSYTRPADTSQSELRASRASSGSGHPLPFTLPSSGRNAPLLKEPRRL